MASDHTSVSIKPVLAGLQLPPLSMLLNTPPDVPAYRVPGVLGLMASDQMSVAVKPVLAGLQLPPLSVLLNNPVDVPA